MNKIYRIAGLLLQMDSFGITEKRAKPYEISTNETPEITVCSHWEKLKEKYSYLSDDEGEYIFSGSNFYRHLLRNDGVMLHSSAVVVDGVAYLFTAHSGTGKSTHTGLWLKKFGDRAYILNDDKPALRLEDGKWYAYGTPWSGKYDISVNTRVPLGGIAVVNRAEKNAIYPYRDRKIISEIYQQVNRPGDTESRIRVLELLNKLLSMVPIWKLECNMDMEAAEIAYAAMSGKRMEE